MMRILKIISVLLILGSWLMLVRIGLTTPTYMRDPMAQAIEHLKHSERSYDSEETWEAMSPISVFTKQISNHVLMFSTLMFVGFLGYSLSTKSNRNTEQAN